MDTKTVLSQLKAERDRIDQVIAALESLDGAKQTTTAPAKAGRVGRRTMSPAARKRIAEAQRKRWAAVKKQNEA
jgi:hypothetical protein